MRAPATEQGRYARVARGVTVAGLLGVTLVGLAACEHTANEAATTQAKPAAGKNDGARVASGGASSIANGNTASAASGSASRAPFPVASGVGAPPESSVNPDDTGAGATGPAIRLTRSPSRAGVPWRAVIFGDFGAPTSRRDKVGRGLAAAANREPFDFGLMLGDNVYECGPYLETPEEAHCRFTADRNTVEPTNEPSSGDIFDRLFEKPLEALHDAGGAPLPIYVALGNHDVGNFHVCAPEQADWNPLARTKACIEVAHHSPRWRMPARHYVIDFGPARFVVFDSNLIANGDYGGFRLADEVRFVRHALGSCRGKLCFLASHHPPVGAEDKPGQTDLSERDYRERAEAFAAAGPYTAWFAGHNHDLEHIDTPQGDVFISGSTAKGHSGPLGAVSAPDAKLVFGSVEPGWAELEIAPEGDTFTVRFRNASGKALSCCRGRAQARCEPFPC